MIAIMKIIINKQKKIASFSELKSRGGLCRDDQDLQWKNLETS